MDTERHSIFADTATLPGRIKKQKRDSRFGIPDVNSVHQKPTVHEGRQGITIRLSVCGELFGFTTVDTAGNRPRFRMIGVETTLAARRGRVNHERGTIPWTGSRVNCISS
jgi:hypothetical protein